MNADQWDEEEEFRKAPKGMSFFNRSRSKHGSRYWRLSASISGLNCGFRGDRKRFRIVALRPTTARRFIGIVSEPVDDAAIYQLERPHPNLWKYYALCCLMVFPAAPILLPIHWFRYHSMRYHFTAEGVSMSWGVLFRRQILLNYARIQDIHLQSNLLERWLGLGRLLIQTASGSSTAEMTIEGLQEFEAVRDFLYSRMRGVKDHPHASTPASSSGQSTPEPPAHPTPAAEEELAGILREIASEVRALREVAEPRNNATPGGPGHV